MPIEEVIELRGAQAARAATNLALLDAAASAQAVLRDSGIPSVVLKGGALLALGLVGPGARTMGDIDLLVPTGRADDAARLLDAAGWRHERDPNAPTVDGAPHAPAPDAGPPPSLNRIAPNGSLVEVHDHLGRVYDVSLAARLLASSTPVAFMGRTLDVCAGAPLVEHLAVHALLQHAAAPDLLLRHLADMVALARSYDLREIERSTVSPTARAAIAASRWAVETPAERWPAPLVRYATAPEAIQHAHHAMTQGVDTLGRVARELRGDPSRLWQKIAPPRSYLAAKFGVPETHPALPLLRLVLPVARLSGPLFQRYVWKRYDLWL